MRKSIVSKSIKAGIISTLLMSLVSFHASAEDKKPSSNDSYTNVALTKSYTVVQEMKDKELMGYETRTDGDNGSQYELTDGKTGSNTKFQDPNWVGYSRQIARSVIIDLEKPTFINSINGGFLRDRPSAIDFPRYINFYVSDDGENWFNAGTVKPETSKSQEAAREEFSTENVNVTARYVKVQFEVGMFSFADEITVLGREAEEKDKKAGTLKKAKAPKDAPLPTKKDTGGVKDMYLSFIYPDHTGNGPLGTWKKDDFNHVITHVDENGKPNGWMFDSILFAMGGDMYQDYKDQNLWNEAINKLFKADVNLDALDASTKEKKLALGDKTRKTKVVLGIPYPALESTNWGTIDGKTLNFSVDQPGGEKASFEARRAAVNWYIELVEKRFKEKDYQNIELAGFYWTHEEIGFRTTYEETLVKETSAILHAKDFKFFWIPFFQSNGTTIWKELGFDSVMMQPNYYFKTFFGPNIAKGGEIDLSRLEAAVNTAKRFGMGLEVEGDYHMLWNGWGTDYDGQVYNSEYAMRKYYAYLNEMKRAGLDETIKGYYLGARTVLADIVKDPVVRETYDETYRFIHGDYQIRELSTETIPPPTGDTWDNPTVLEAKEGDVYTTPKALSKAQWYKFPIKAGEDWVVTLTPIEGAAGMESRLWGPTQTPHSGFSYNKSTQVQSLVVSNPTNSDTYGMIRVFLDSDTSKYKITLSRPIEDGTSMVNSIELANGASLTCEATTAGQNIWYRISGKKAYSLSLQPKGTNDVDFELYYDLNSGYPQAVSSKPAGETEVINYSNPYAESFVYYLKVKAKTAGQFTITNQ
ncbi:DUF4855 domain-containing protein [Neobacillus drentensis]|uniref:DUF4855 domain-containing protein n=1 Tax=Neobacillus drentensis TaxID=220684 RepID=UPI002FFEA4A3